MRRSILLATITGLLVAACNTIPSTTDLSTQMLPVPPPGSIPPVVILPASAPHAVASNPTNFAVGVPRYSATLITFDRGMDIASVQAAFSAKVNQVPITGSFYWDSRAEILKFVPANDYAYGAVVDIYISSAARSAAQDQADPFALHFTVTRLHEARIIAAPALDGHVLIQYDGGIFSYKYKNVTYTNESVIRVGDRAGKDIASMGFMSFDLSSLPAGANVLNATLAFYTNSLIGNPGNNLGGLRVVSHSYGTLDGSDLDPSKWNDWCHDPNRPKCALFLETKAGFQVAYVTELLRFDLAHRSQNGQRSQYRFFYNTMKNDNNLGDYADITSADTGSNYAPSLSLTYEGP
jgi:Bacterial Ig-like domain